MAVPTPQEEFQNALRLSRLPQAEQDRIAADLAAGRVMSETDAAQIPLGREIRGYGLAVLAAPPAAPLPADTSEVDAGDTGEATIPEPPQNTGEVIIPDEPQDTGEVTIPETPQETAEVEVP